MKKIRMWTMLFLTVLIIFPASAHAAEGKGAAEEDPLAGCDWSDYVIAIDGEVMQFPMRFSAFEAYGYEAEDDLTMTLDPMQYSWFYFKKGGRRVSFTIANFDSQTRAAGDSVVCGITIDSFFWPVTDGDVRLPGGIVRGVSTMEDVAAAYGTPSDIYEGELYTRVTYETDIYEDLELEFDAESGLLSDIDVRRIAEPEKLAEAAGTAGAAESAKKPDGAGTADSARKPDGVGAVDSAKKPDGAGAGSASKRADSTASDEAGHRAA